MAGGQQSSGKRGVQEGGCQQYRCVPVFVYTEYLDLLDEATEISGEPAAAR
jgi:hypothetical protein